MPSATILSVQMGAQNQIVLDVSLDDVTLADKSVPTYQIVVNTRNLEVWLLAKDNKDKTVKEYVQSIIDAVVADYKKTQDVLSQLQSGAKMSW